MIRIRDFTILVMLAAGVCFPAMARACPPPPPPPLQAPGESTADYQARLAKVQADMAAAVRTAISQRQARLWAESPVILVGEVVKTRRGKAPFYGPGQSAYIRPKSRIRGGAGRKGFWLEYKSYTSCGPVGGGDAVDGKPGERFVLFAREGHLSSKSILDSVGAKTALDQRIVDALAKSK